MSYDPQQPRDWHGRWAFAGGSSGPGSFLQDAAYNGHYHDFVVDWTEKNMARDGVRCIHGPRLTTWDGTTAIPDLICLSPKDGTLAIIEVKTGENPTFTKNQLKVYAMVQFDNHVLTADNKLSAFGIPAGETLLAMEVDVVYAARPGALLEHSQPFKIYRGMISPWMKK